MKKIAEVIVDVPTMQTDQPYTYLIPKELENSVSVGMRVEVAFGLGNRHLQGFVIGLQNYSDEKMATLDFELKPIVKVIDLAPVLNTELLQLADYMKDETYAFKITCLQTMLPSVMRANYEKFIVLIDELSEDDHHRLFYGLDEISWNEAEENGTLLEMMTLKRQGNVEIRYEVHQRNKVKKSRFVKPILTFEGYEEAMMDLRKTATKKRKLLAVLQQLDEKGAAVKKLKEAGFSTSLLNEGETNGWLTYYEEEVYRDPYAGKEIVPSTALALTEEQEVVHRRIQEARVNHQDTCFLLEGVTGSGKTEVYLQTIAEVLTDNKTAMMLVPEISLTPQTVRRFKNRFGDEVAVLHSGLSEGEKYDEWRKIERKEARVVVGARSAVFAPLENLGVIIIDEEHESSYKQEDNPRYHARDIALWRSHYHQCPVILGSATPSLESRARAQKKLYQLLTLTKRANANALLPQVEIIDMRQEFQSGNMQQFSRSLLEKIKDRLAKEEQIVLLLNRRGYSSFVMCRDCGYVLPCPNCDISLTLHMDTKTMKCHYCGHEEAIPHRCPICRSDKIRYYGTGTQKVEEELQKILPESRILRMDVDTTRRKGAHEKILDAFGKKEADILLGTQMIAKGLDFENVTLVGVLNADTALNLPDFRSSERTFQLLTQVSGRAGRGDKPGEVVIQTFNPGHYAIQLAQSQDYEAFYQKEMVIRHQAGYPPYYFTVLLTCSHEEEIQAAKKMYEMVNYLKAGLSPDTQVLGPTPKAVMRVNNRYYYQTVIKYKKEPELHERLKNILQDSQKEIQRGLLISIDPEPMNFI